MGFLSKNIGIIRSTEFGLSLGCGLTALAMGTDPLLMTIVLVLGLILAVLGIVATTTLGPAKKWLYSGLAFVVFFAEGCLLYWHTFPKNTDGYASWLLVWSASHPWCYWLGGFIVGFAASNLYGALRNSLPKQEKATQRLAYQDMLIPLPAGDTKETKRERAERRRCINEARTIVAKVLETGGRGEDVRRALARSEAYLRLRAYMSASFIGKMQSVQMTTSVLPEPTPLIAEAFFDELQRLEKEWGFF